MSVATAAFAVLAGVGVGIPAYANVLDDTQQSAVAAAPQQQQPLQSLTVAEAAPVVPINPRDAYTVYVPPKPPALQYPLTTGTGITSGFGPRGGRMHEGADLFPGAGTQIHAIAAGVVSKATHAGAYGQHVTIDHVIDGQKVTSLYAHMISGSMTVSAGQQVAVGQVIGLVGETGNAQGAHLHFEVRPGGAGAVDPYPWIAARL